MKRFIQMLPMLASALLVAVTFITPAAAQDQGQDTPRAERADRGDRGDRGDRRARPDWNNMTDEQREQMRARFSERFEEMRKQQAQRMREDLELSEDEFSAIQPMIENVQQLSLESQAVGRGGSGGPGGPGGPGGAGGFGGFGGRGGFSPADMGIEMTPQGRALNDAATALRETLDNDATSSEDIKSRLAAVRQARVAMQDALRQAREELRGFVTPKQEATLVLQGLLD